MFCCFKQKTAYELRISYWSSDVCSSDLRPVEARRDGGRDIDEPPFAIGFPEPAAPRALEIAHQIERALLVADREARRARRAPLMPDVFEHHHDEQAQKHETGDPERPGGDPDRAAQRRGPGKGEQSRPPARPRRSPEECRGRK